MPNYVINMLKLLTLIKNHAYLETSPRRKSYGSYVEIGSHMKCWDLGEQPERTQRHNSRKDGKFRRHHHHHHLLLLLLLHIRSYADDFQVRYIASNLEPKQKSPPQSSWLSQMAPNLWFPIPSPSQLQRLLECHSQCQRESKCSLKDLLYSVWLLVSLGSENETLK